MMTEHDQEFEPWPAQADPIITAIMPLIEHIFTTTAPDSAERKAAMNETLAVVERIKQALRPRPRLH